MAADGADPVGGARAPGAGTGGGIEGVHLGLAPLRRAAEAAEARIELVPVPMHWPPARGPLPRGLDQPARALAFLLAHLRLGRALWRRRRLDLIVVREFLTLLLLAVWPLIWPLRRNVVFLLNHNLQEAERRPLERLALRVLDRSGCRFACLETAAAARAVGLRDGPDHLLVLPHPLELSVPPRPPGRGRPVVGVVGEMRGEKGVEALLGILSDARRDGRLEVDLLLGCPDPGAQAAWRAAGFEVVGTALLADYLEALDRSDVVVINYRRERYYWRASGVAADALSRRAAVVCPDFPVIRHQLTVPEPVGALFEDEADLVPAIERALALPGRDAALAAHASARGVAELARRLDRFVDRARRGRS